MSLYYGYLAERINKYTPMPIKEAKIKKIEIQATTFAKCFKVIMYKALKNNNFYLKLTQ